MTSRFLLLITVVRKSRGERVVEIVRGAGAAGSTILMGRGAADSRILRLLFLGDTEKELVFTIAPADQMGSIIEALKSASDLCRKTPGIGLTIDVTFLARSGAPQPFTFSGENAMPAGRSLICAIVNSGFAYDIMQAAREAGAKGGTVVRARGTASEKDSSFFGITIVPEKEMILILATDSECPPILEAVRGCPFFSEPGAGIVFCLPVSQFFQLGPKAGRP